MRTNDAPAVAAAPTLRTPSTCSVCPHELSAHDRIGTRYCSATIAGGLGRGCVCVGDAGAAPTRVR